MVASGLDDLPFVLDACALIRLLDYPSLTARIGVAFTDPIHCPDRLVIDRDGESTLLVMAAARDGGIALTKSVTVGAAGVRSQVVVLDPNGNALAGLDGETLTARRTAAASVRAAALLARPDARVLAVLGAGPQAAAQARAYAACRSLERIVVWARQPERAEAFAAALRRDVTVPVDVIPEAAAAVRAADIVTAATRAREPIVRAADVRPGTHIDLVGGFRPDMREADDDLLARASVVADTRRALVEAGDLAGPIAAGRLRPDQVALFGDLLGRGFDRPRDAVTVNKSVGFAALDLVAAELALEGVG